MFFLHIWLIIPKHSKTLGKGRGGRGTQTQHSSKFAITVSKITSLNARPKLSTCSKVYDLVLQTFKSESKKYGKENV